MSYAIDLTPRQSSRIIEQALRHQADVVLEPRIFEDDEAINTKLEAVLPPGGSPLRPATLVVAVIAPATPDVTQIAPVPVTVPELALLVGTCCDGTIKLGDARYLFDADVMRIEPASDAPVIGACT